MERHGEPRAGVLALQGDFEPHARALRACGIEPVLVKRREQLEGLTHLVLPGGESTTQQHLAELFGLWEPIRQRHRAGKLALFGTCAGAILLGRDGGERPPRLGLLDATVERNAYGPQVESFETRVDVEGVGSVPATFIRAPRIVATGPSVRVLARLGGDPVAVAAPGVLATTFHPELSDVLRMHAAFLEGVPPVAPAKAVHLSRGR
jgi:pyridoxal 5'-phosphate synthase pdxT subunit